MAVETGDGKRKVNVLGQPGKCAIYEYMKMFDLMQPIEVWYRSVVRTVYSFNSIT